MSKHRKRSRPGQQTWRVREQGIPFRVDAEQFTREQGLIMQLERGFYEHPDALVIRLPVRDIIDHTQPIGTEFDTYREAVAAIKRFAERRHVLVLLDGRENTAAGARAQSAQPAE